MTANDTITLDKIEQWLVEQVAQALNQHPDQIDKNTPLLAFGFDSLYLQSFFAEVEKGFRIRIDKDFILEEENLKEFAGIIHSYMIRQKANPKVPPTLGLY